MKLTCTHAYIQSGSYWKQHVQCKYGLKRPPVDSFWWVVVCFGMPPGISSHGVWNEGSTLRFHQQQWELPVKTEYVKPTGSLQMHQAWGYISIYHILNLSIYQSNQSTYLSICVYIGICTYVCMYVCIFTHLIFFWEMFIYLHIYI